MKTFNTLIRLSKRTLDALRKQQADLERQKEKLLEAVGALVRELENETRTAQKAPEMGAFFGGFAKRIKERQATLQEEIKLKDAELTSIAEEISSAFADLKKYEIARDNKKARLAADEARKEMAQMDEIAATQHRRKEEQV